MRIAPFLTVPLLAAAVLSGHAATAHAADRLAVLSSMTANVISTAGDATLSAADSGHLANGTFALPEPLQAGASSPAGTDGAPAPVGGAASPTALLSYAAPVANDPVTIAFAQHIGATDALRTGAYTTTVTFTLATTMP